ncbi:hypothetical protein SDC9_180826 [bioreactor metagenome]|uniref:Uncharacterized protein n=1 Tax=bioreactor metagenome TaxID=1076179 RepID=A0A645H3R0_9ZZZZ
MKYFNGDAPLIIANAEHEPFVFVQVHPHARVLHVMLDFRRIVLHLKIMPEHPALEPYGKAREAFERAPLRFF